MSKEFIILSGGGVGDAVVSTPTYKALRQAYPKSKIIVYCKNKGHYNVFLNNPNIDSLRMLKIRSMWKYPYHLYSYLFNRKKVKFYNMQFQHIPPTWIYEKNVKEIIPEIFGLEVKNPVAELFFTSKEEEKAELLMQPFTKPVLMHVHSRSSQNHHWQMDKWEALIDSLPGYSFIQVGNKDEELIKNAIDFRGKTSLREAMCMMKFAYSFVGIESSFAHISGVFDIPGVVLFGDTSPLYWGNSNNFNIYKNVSCAPCYYDLWSKPCPYGHECMTTITVEEVRSAFLQQVSKRSTTVINID
ncbi:MAG TPA: glycosyltransferase family 9 protein [Segetibacter sp.]